MVQDNVPIYLTSIEGTNVAYVVFDRDTWEGTTYILLIYNEASLFIYRNVNFKENYKIFLDLVRIRDEDSTVFLDNLRNIPAVNNVKLKLLDFSILGQDVDNNF